MQLIGISEIYIEKDYWIKLVLYTIYSNEIGKEVVFKGGTSLSKCSHLIDRFSEDIDLVVLRKVGETNNQLKGKLKKISSCVARVIPEIEIDGLTKKLGMIRKTFHSYEKHFEGNFHQVRDTIVIESTWLGNFEPYTIGEISSYIYEMMANSNQEEMIAKYELKPFEVLVLSIERTFCEKIMSLVRFSHSATPIADLKNKIRHTYDIHMMLKDQVLNDFFHSMEFDHMLLRVAKDDKLSFKRNIKWITKHPKDAEIFSNTENTWNLIRNTYNTSFKELVFGEFPSENEILEPLLAIGQRLKMINWTLE